MKILLGLESVGNPVTTAQRQQITPAVTFTCDGMITKWIIGANWTGGASLYPELQVWRNIGNDVYHRNIHKYWDNNFKSYLRVQQLLSHPIPSRRYPGSVSASKYRLRITSEANRSPLNYYIRTTKMADMSPYDTIDLQQSDPQQYSSIYHPLVTVEIGEKVSHESQFL